MLALSGAISGLLLAASAIKVFRALAKTLPRVNEIALDWRILLYTLGCAVIVAVLCGLFPSLQATRRSIAGGIGE